MPMKNESWSLSRWSGCFLPIKTICHLPARCRLEGAGRADERRQGRFFRGCWITKPPGGEILRQGSATGQVLLERWRRCFGWGDNYTRTTRGHSLLNGHLEGGGGSAHLDRDSERENWTTKTRPPVRRWPWRAVRAKAIRRVGGLRLYVFWLPLKANGAQTVRFGSSMN